MDRRKVKFKAKGTIVIYVSSLYPVDALTLGNQYVLEEEFDLAKPKVKNIYKYHYCIKNDNGNSVYYPQAYFIALEDYRKQTIDNILNDET